MGFIRKRINIGFILSIFSCYKIRYMFRFLFLRHFFFLSLLLLSLLFFQCLCMLWHAQAQAPTQTRTHGTHVATEIPIKDRISIGMQINIWLVWELEHGFSYDILKFCFRCKDKIRATNAYENAMLTRTNNMNTITRKTVAVPNQRSLKKKSKRFCVCDSFELMKNMYLISLLYSVDNLLWICACVCVVCCFFFIPFNSSSIATTIREYWDENRNNNDNGS